MTVTLKQQSNKFS